MILSGLSRVREYLENLEMSGNLKKGLESQGKVEEKFLVKFSNIKCLFCQLTISLIEAIWELQRVGHGKFIKNVRENLEKSGNFKVKIMW